MTQMFLTPSDISTAPLNSRVEHLGDVRDGRPSILCMALDPEKRMAMQDYGEILDWELLLCSDVCELIDRLTRRDFDLVILERCVTAVSEVISDIRTGLTATAKAPIIVIVDSSFEGETRDAMSQSNVHCLRAVPLLTSSLQRIVSRHISRRR